MNNFNDKDILLIVRDVDSDEVNYTQFTIPGGYVRTEDLNKIEDFINNLPLVFKKEGHPKNDVVVDTLNPYKFNHVEHEPIYTLNPYEHKLSSYSHPKLDFLIKNLNFRFFLSESVSNPITHYIEIKAEFDNKKLHYIFNSNIKEDIVNYFEEIVNELYTQFSFHSKKE